MGVSSSCFADGRMGLHYFPDTLHYREADLQTWLPELQALGVSWLVLRSTIGRAVPESFLRGLEQAGIQPVIQFHLPLERLPERREVETLLSVYARWGARYVVLFDRPNARSAWPSANWIQQDLVERFLDRYLPVASLALETGLTPVFPPLEPGGSYWDTTFLRSALQAMLRRRQELLLQKQILSAYAWSGNRSLDWGAGGPERWPEARPYLTPAGSQDQLGFRVFDWYATIARSVLHRDPAIMLFQAGSPGDAAGLNRADLAQGTESGASCLPIARLLGGEEVADPLAPENPLEPIPAQVVACNFWLLSAGASSPDAGQAWYQEDGRRGAAAEALRKWRQDCRLNAVHQASSGERTPEMDDMHSIRHYLLLPGQEGGISDWYLEIIRPFVKRHRPTIGFSVEEAVRAERVTVVGAVQNYPEDALSRLSQAGCWIEQIQGNGIDIATQLAER